MSLAIETNSRNHTKSVRDFSILYLGKGSTDDTEVEPDDEVTCFKGPAQAVS